MTATDGLAHDLEALAEQPTLLVVCDFDGTLSPLVQDPAAAQPLPEAVAALEELASLPSTHVAVVSGRSLGYLSGLGDLPSEASLVGSHGSEFDDGFLEALTPAQVALRDALTTDLTALAADHPGFIVEEKPASVAFHYRNADPDAAAPTLDAVRSGPAARPGVHTKEGKMVVELAVVETSKGTAIDRLRAQVSADGLLFAGDDVTDEDGFAHLTQHDIGIKVGPGDTRATHRVDDTAAFARTLETLAELRRRWATTT